MKYGKCDVCHANRVMRQYKIKGDDKHFQVLYPCSKSVGHSYSDVYLTHMNIDIAWHKSETERLKSIKVGQAA